MDKKVGFVTFFLNFNEHNKHLDVDQYIELFRKHNKAAIDQLDKEGFVAIILPCYDEACRVKKTYIIDNTDDQEEGSEEV